MSAEAEDVGRRIKQARERKGLSQLELALQANVSPSTIYRWEKGLSHTVPGLRRLSELLGLALDDLVTAPVETRTVDDARLERLEGRIEEALGLLRDIGARLPSGEPPPKVP